jgi:hypothetical protein
VIPDDTAKLLERTDKPSRAKRRRPHQTPASTGTPMMENGFCVTAPQSRDDHDLRGYMRLIGFSCAEIKR